MFCLYLKEDEPRKVVERVAQNNTLDSPMRVALESRIRREIEKRRDKRWETHHHTSYKMYEKSVNGRTCPPHNLQNCPQCWRPMNNPGKKWRCWQPVEPQPKPSLNVKEQQYGTMCDLESAVGFMFTSFQSTWIVLPHTLIYNCRNTWRFLGL